MPPAALLYNLTPCRHFLTRGEIILGERCARAHVYVCARMCVCYSPHHMNQRSELGIASAPQRLLRLKASGIAEELIHRATERRTFMRPRLRAALKVNWHTEELFSFYKYFERGDSAGSLGEQRGWECPRGMAFSL